MLRNYRTSLRVNEVSEAIKKKGLLRLYLAMTVPDLSLICHFIYEMNNLGSGLILDYTYIIILKLTSVLINLIQ